MTPTWQIGFLLVTCGTRWRVDASQASQASQADQAEGKHHDGHILDDYAEPNYQYRYGVADRKTGDVKGAWEKRAGDTVWGAYWLRDADGYWRTVHYNADKSGFKAVVKRRPLLRKKQPAKHPAGSPGRHEEYQDVSWEDVVHAVRQDEAAKAAKDAADKQLEELLGPAWNEVEPDSLGFDRPDWLEPKGKSAKGKLAEDTQKKQPDIHGKELLAWATDSDGEKVPISIADDLKTEDVDLWIGPPAVDNTKKGALWSGRPIHVQEGRTPARQGKESILSSDGADSGREPVSSKWYDADVAAEEDGVDLPQARTAVGSGNVHKGPWHRSQALRWDDKGPWSEHKGGEKRGSWSSLSGKASAVKGEHSAWTESKVQKTASVKSPNDGLLIWPNRKTGAVHTWAAVPVLPQAGYSRGKESPELSFSGWTPMEVTPRPDASLEGQKRVALPSRKKEAPDGTSLWPKGKRNKYIAHDKGSKSVNKDGRSVKSEGNSGGAITVGSDNDHARANYFWHTRWA